MDILEKEKQEAVLIDMINQLESIKIWAVRCQEYELAAHLRKSQKVILNLRADLLLKTNN